jgi:hypothetical protein
MPRSHVWFALMSLAAASACRRSPPPGAPARAPAGDGPDVALALDPAAAEDAALVKKVAAAFLCFERQMRKSHEDPRFARYSRTSFTDVFFFDRVAADRGIVARSEVALCEGTVQDYRALFLSTLATQATAAGPARAPRHLGDDLGASLPVDGEPAFIRAAGNRTALHILWHAEITRAALLETTAGRPRPVFATVSYGALQPDLHRWPDLRYHAQTGPFDPATRDAEIATAQTSFVGLVASTIHDFNEQVRQGSFDQAAIFLGVACHAVQDAVLHRGITRRQLAGLRFASDDRDPYAPERAPAAEAKRWTKEILAVARAAIGDERLWARFLAWSPPAHFDLSKVADTVFSDDAFNVPLNYVNLTRHWLAQLAYQRSPALRQELGGGPDGLVRWDVAKLLERVRRSVENGGVALHDRTR